jgi:hypothetical protein
VNTLGKAKNGRVRWVASDTAFLSRVGSWAIELGTIAQASDNLHFTEAVRCSDALFVGVTTDADMSVSESNILHHLHFSQAQLRCFNDEAKPTILPSVKVPVLSEQRIDMQPSVSIVARFFTRTCRFAMRFAIMARDSATQIGRPWGTKAVRQPIELTTAVLALMKPGYEVRSQTAQTISAMNGRMSIQVVTAEESAHTDAEEGYGHPTDNLCEYPDLLLNSRQLHLCLS